MMLRVWTTLWVIIAVVLSYEYFALNTNPQNGLLFILQSSGILSKSFPLNPAPGRPLSLWLGWSGFSIMVLTNLYILRKRTSIFSKWGKLGNWLNFHIFCGLVGPTFILFHCNFKVGGLVGISFWSMVISFASGVVGRYFYVNILQTKKKSIEDSERYWQKIVRRLQKANVAIDGENVKNMKIAALAFVGHPGKSVNILNVLGLTMLGDIRRTFRSPSVLPGMARDSAEILDAYAVSLRRAASLGPFQKMMGYWHTFHMPFAVFMYVVAVIHIISALFFGV